MNDRRQPKMSRGARRAVVLGGLFVLPVALLSSPTNEAARLSPFTAVVCEEDKATVEFEGRHYELVSINDLATKTILDYCKETYGKLWEKRFAEDLVAVLGMGYSPGNTVRLVLRNTETRTEYVIPQATMTTANRQAVWRARHRDLRTPRRGSAAHELSPFTSVACEGDKARVEFEGRHAELVSMDGVATKAIFDYCKETYGELWEKRFAEDLVTVLTGMGRSPGDTIKLVLRDPETSEEWTVDRAPLTHANRQEVWRERRETSRVEELVETIRTAAISNDLGERVQVAFKQLQEHGTAAVPVAARLLDDESPQARWAGAELVEELIEEIRERRRGEKTDDGPMPPEVLQVIPALLQALKDEDDRVRGKAASALGWMGPDASAALTALEEACDDESEAVRERARRAIGRIQIGSREPLGRDGEF